ncbi:MAG: vitamin B12 dependent-methionine synthase activation domain-containing protein, partial [Elusimicrobia bacterium]|nr:vitamin B12 dependent-methionine synthase activation domain-containing protein [Elusimicrobiota bacterium]
IRGGARIIDVCLSNPDRDEERDMVGLLERLAPASRVPIMIDSLDPAVVEAALRRCPGKSIINSVNLEGGPQRMAAIARLARRYGAALVVGAIDEDRDQGMALTRERKLAVVRRCHGLLTKEYGVPEPDLYFDCLVFPAASGDLKYRGGAAETVAALPLVKRAFPECRTVLGVSNVSFGLPPAGREVLNAVFLARCVEAGLDLAIVNVEKLPRISDIPEAERRLAEALLDWDGTSPGGADPAAAFAGHFRGRPKTPAAAPAAKPPAEQRVRRAVVDGLREGLAADLDELLGRMPPVEIINGPLMAGMAEVGVGFGRGELIVAEVLQRAEVMRFAVERLEPLLASRRCDGRGVVALATVKGDVHDIGKNLVHIILKNNGYRIEDLGIKASSQCILEGVRGRGAQALGLSGLLVRSCQEMAAAARDLAQAGIAIPIVAGGAALSERFVAQKIAPAYGGPVFYAKDAMAGLAILNGLFSPQRDRLVAENAAAQRRLRAQAGAAPAPGVPARTGAGPRPPAPAPPDLELHALRLDPEEVFRAVDSQMLYGRSLGLKGPAAKLLEQGDAKAVELSRRVRDIHRQAVSRGLLECRAAYRFFPCQSAGDSILLYEDASGRAARTSFAFPRTERFCLADLVAPKSSGHMDFMALFVVSTGAGAREETARLRELGAYLDSHAFSALALALAEAGAEVLHRRLREQWGLAGRGRRFSFGFPACPALEPQARLLELLDARATAGVTLTGELMMDPEASVSALVFPAEPGSA